MGGRDLTILVLDQMQMFDEKIAPPRPIPEQNFDFMRSSRVDLASLGRGFGTLAAAAGMLERANLVHVMTHRTPRPLAYLWVANVIGGMPDAKSQFAQPP